MKLHTIVENKNHSLIILFIQTLVQSQSLHTQLQQTKSILKAVVLLLRSITVFHKWQIEAMLRAPPYHRHLQEVAGGGVISSSPPPATGAEPHEGLYGSEASFDTNMVIILAALLCALICALGLNSIVRCALRCTGQLLPGPAQDPSDGGGARVAVGCRGLKRSTLRQIPVAIYEENPSNSNVMISTDCIICLGEFVEGEKIRVLPKCKHGFHVRCIDVWLLSHSSCPTCRQPVVPEWAEMGGGIGGGATGNGGGNDGIATQRQGPSEVIVTVVG